MNGVDQALIFALFTTINYVHYLFINIIHKLHPQRISLLPPIIFNKYKTLKFKC